MKTKMISAAFVAAFLCLSTSVFADTTFDYANTTSSVIQFAGDGTFTISPTANNFQVTDGSAAGLVGEITGTYTIGTITTVGSLSTAPVTGTGTLVIHDGANDLTATLDWIDIAQSGTLDFLNTSATVNLTSITYAGSNPDLVALKNAGSAVNVFSFQFASPVALSDLKTSSHTTSFSGTINATSPTCNCTLTFSGPASLTNCAQDAIPDVTATNDCGSGPVQTPVTVTGAVTNGVCPQIITRTNTATDGCGTVHTFVQTITVNCRPDCTITTSVTETTVGTTGLTASVQNAGPGASYSWNVLNGTITGGQNTPNLTFTAGSDTSNPITIVVQVTAATGCQNTCSASIKLNPNNTPCIITGVTISNTSWNKFPMPSGSSVVWVHMHIGSLKGIPTTSVTTVNFTGVTLSLNGTPYSLPDGVMTFDPSAPSTITTSFSGGKWLTTVNPNNLSDEMFFTGAAIPVTASIAAGAKATVTYNTSASVTGLSFSWQWSAAVYTFWPSDWNQAMIQPYHNSYHAGTPLNTTVQKSLVQGPRGGGGSNFTGSWSATGTAECQ